MTTRKGLSRSPSRARFHLLGALFVGLFSLLSARTALAEDGSEDGSDDGPTETNCTDGKDNDGDLVYDCGDHDCHDDPACQPDGQPESTEARCADWVDNDGNGYKDCEDDGCTTMTVCKGSWDLELEGKQPAVGATDPGTGSGGSNPAVVPAPATGGAGSADPADLIGTGDDADGERSNYFCSDGVDNDNDGYTDCEDVGCRLDTQVTVCQPTGNFRFSVVARIQAIGFDFPQEGDDNLQDNLSTEFDALQLRVLGQMPFIQNSFFLISARAEKTPRVTFATFQVPIRNGHYVNVNSGGGGLSLELVRSVHKRLMVDPAFYVYNAFEQGNGAALEFGGPVTKNGKLLYRTFVAGGSGRFAGNVGGTFFPDENRNYTFAVGGQLHANIIGYYNRFDSPMLFTPVPTTFTFVVGAKYDQRAQERYPAVNIQSVFRWRRIILMAEAYAKRELNFSNNQLAYNAQFGVLAVKKRLLLSADWGQYIATEFENPPVTLGSDLRRQLQESQARGAAHVYLWRDVFYASALYRYRLVETPPTDPNAGDFETEQDVRLMVTYRF